MRRIAAGLMMWCAVAGATPRAAHAQRAMPIALSPVHDTIPAARRVRSLPVTIGGTIAGAAVGGAIGIALGVATSRATGAPADEFFGPEAVGGFVGGVLGYVLGAGVGAHLTASSAPRPNPAATIGISALAAAGAGAAALAANNAFRGDYGGIAAGIAFPVVHLGITAAFAHWRARTAP